MSDRRRLGRPGTTTKESVMAEAQGTPPAAVKGGIVAYLCVEGAQKAGDFYKKAFHKFRWQSTQLLSNSP